MLIMNQSKKNLVNMETASEIFLSTSYGEPQKEGPVRVLAMTSVGISDEASIVLGEYESEARAMEVLGEIADEYGKYLSTAGGPLATVEAFVQPFAYAPPKVYRMPER